MHHKGRLVGSTFTRFDAGASSGMRPMAGWKINGHPARLLIWSEEEWEHLEVRPIDAQYHPYGFWCALRLLE